VRGRSVAAGGVGTGVAEERAEEPPGGVAVVCVPPGTALPPALSPDAPGPPESSDDARSDSQDGRLPSDPVAVDPLRPEPVGLAPVPGPEPSSVHAATAVIRSIDPAVAATAVERLKRRMFGCYEHGRILASAERPGPPSHQYAGVDSGQWPTGTSNAVPPPTARLVEPIRRFPRRSNG
jgi:hypothetical protein